MPSNESTTKFKADITDFKKAMQEAGRYVRLANSEFKEATASLGKWSNSTEGVNKKITQLNNVLEAQERQLAVLETEYKKVVNEQGATSRGAQELEIRINNQKAAIQNTQKEINDWTDALDDLEREQKEAVTPLSELTKEIEDQEKQLTSLKNEYKNAIFSNNAEEAKRLEGEIKNVSSELANNKKKMSELDGEANKLDESIGKTSDGFTVMKGALANLVADGIRAAIGAMKDMVGETIEVGKTFDSTMSKVQAVSGATGKEYEALREKAKEMGSTTSFTATEAGEAFNYMAMAGWKTEDMLNGVEGIMNLAAASGADLATASDIVTDALTAMGYGAEDAGRLADVMAAASSNANTNVEMMGQTFKYAAPVIGAMGYSMEDAAVAIGLMANSGIKGETAGTSLRAIMSRLAAPTKEVQTAMDVLGLSITNADGTMKPLNQVIVEMQTAFDGLSESQQAQYAKNIAGTDAMSGLLSIVNAAPADFDKLTEAVNGSEGAAEKMATTMLDNLGGDMTLLQSKLEGVQLAIYEKFEPAMREGVKVLDSLLDAIQFVVDHSTEFIAALTAMAAGIAAYVAYTTALTVMEKGWMALTVVQKAAAAAQWALNAAQAANPMGLIIAAVVALVAAFVVLWKKSEGFRNFWINLWDNIKGVISTVVNWIKENWQSMLLFLINPLAGIFKYCYEHFEGFRNFVDTTIQAIKSYFSNMWEGLKEIFGSVAEWININVFEPIMAFFEPVINFFQTSWEIISQLAKGCWEVIKLVWQAVSAWFNTNVIQPVKKFFTDLWNALKTSAKTTWEGIKKIWSVVSTWFKNTITTPVSNFFSTMWNKLKSGASSAWSGIKSVFGGVADWFETKFKNAWTKVKNVFSTGGKIFDGIKEGITNAFKSVVNAIINGINKIIATPFNAINKMLDKIKGVSIMGIQPFKGLISRFDVPKIPTLAKGGVIKGARHIIAGEDGAEAIVPLEKNKEWIKKIVDEVMKIIGDLDFDVHIDLDDIGHKIQKSGGANNISNNSRSQIINFTQNIQSPKAMDRLSVYRETNNLLFSAKVRLNNV